MLQEAAGRLTNAQVYIDDSGMITGLEMKAKARRLASERGLDMVIVDYLQLAHGDNRTQRKDLEIAEISHGLKALAKELDIPVIAVSQLNRGPEQRDPDKRRPNPSATRPPTTRKSHPNVTPGFMTRANPGSKPARASVARLPPHVGQGRPLIDFTGQPNTSASARCDAIGARGASARQINATAPQ